MDDISFCPKKCSRKNCFRNSINIRDKSVPHSYFVDTPPDCPRENPIEKKIRSKTLLLYLDNAPEGEEREKVLKEIETLKGQLHEQRSNV